MRDLIESSSQQHMSPNAFIADLESHHQLPYLHVDLHSQQSFGAGNSGEKRSIGEHTKGSEKVQKKRLAGLKSREKKKKQLEGLEDSVKRLTADIQQYDMQISKCKTRLVEAIKTSTISSSEHSFTFSELQKTVKIEDPDLDRINLLLDLIQNRIGANAKERQSKIEYNFKQIINSLFPAMHRYFMHSAVYSTDLFKEKVTTESLIAEGENRYTKSLYEAVGLTQDQIDKIYKMKNLFIGKRRETVRLISKLKDSKLQLKQQQQKFEYCVNHIREDMNPIQSAKVILFGQTNKLRQEFSLFCDQFLEISKTSKKIKTQ